MKNSKQSPAMALIRHVYDEQGHQMGRSRERFHAGVRSAVRLTLEYGLRFDAGDFAALAKAQSQSYHDTSVYHGDECDYAIACGSERGRFNTSAAISFEAWMGRKPFTIADPDATSPTRIHVGRRFIWKGEQVTCTSFAPDGQSLIACSYKPDKKGFDSSDIKRRHKITQDDLAEARAEARRATEPVAADSAAEVPQTAEPLATEGARP